MSASNEYYSKIVTLVVPKSVQYIHMHININKFIDAVPYLTERLESDFNNIAERRTDFNENMDALILLIKAVYAKSLEPVAEAIQKSVRTDPNMTAANKLLKSFITMLLSLSIEMLKAQRQDDEAEEEVSAAVGQAETHVDTANNLSAVGKLINSGDYDKAENMIVGMKEANPETMMFKLLDLVTNKRYGEAEDLAGVLKEQHVEAITQLAGVDLSKKILAVDDRPEILSFVNNALKNHYKVFGATGGSTALRVMEAQKPDLFILDIDMPEMDGFELAEKIRGKAEYAKTPVIFLTGNPSRDRTLRAMELGAKDFIIKPVSHEVLLSKVGKYLNTVGLVEHYQQMLARYERDELTGLNGANKFRDFVKGIERRSASTGVVFFDVNDLKKYNDNVGHHAGDLLLKKAAESIEMVAGGNVHGFRTGGDEFVVVITDCTETDIAMFMKNWHNKLKELNTKDDGITCVMAAGAAFGTGNYEMDKVMKTADERMYADKKRIKAAKGEVPR